MDYLQKGSYSEKISQIRARIMSKQRDRQQGRQGAYKHTSKNSSHLRNPHKYESSLGKPQNLEKPAGRAKQCDSRQKDTYATLQRENIDYRARQSQGTRARDNFEERKPLEVRKQAESNVMDRVKELESVNDKIKLMLANKREPHSNSSAVAVSAPRSISQNRREHLENLTPKRMTSLFQNEQPIVESKVASREKRMCEYDNPPRAHAGKDSSRERRRTVLDLAREGQRARSKDYYYAQTPLAAVSAETERQKDGSPCQRRFLSFAGANNEDSLLTFKKEDNHQLRPFETNMRPSAIGESRKLISRLSKQIELDIKLRESKAVFNAYAAEDKFEIIRKKVRTYGVTLTNEALEDWISLSKEQQDPFFETGPSLSFDFQEFAARIVASWDFWNNQIQQSADIGGLEREGFRIQDIDLGRRGYISTQDLVCYINVNADTFFRSRDACQIFRRLTKIPLGQKFENRLSYELFLGFMVK